MKGRNGETSGFAWHAQWERVWMYGIICIVCIDCTVPVLFLVAPPILANHSTFNRALSRVSNGVLRVS